ncbi:MAG: fumarylacetoacetate hydrolase family protein [Chitinophagaceae bacterium]
MKVYKTTEGIVIIANDSSYLLKESNWDEFINRDELYQCIRKDIAGLAKQEPGFRLSETSILPPIGSQEVWAAGVTYLRSKTARMEESKESGADTFYDKVYDAERPEIFFKSTGPKVVGTNKQVRIRRDSTWNVPEPELTLFINSAGNIQGYTVGNDMSSRSIEGENPLYLPQAKTYDGSAALGPCILVTENAIPPTTRISMQILRRNVIVFQGSVEIAQMKRSHQELVGYLYRENSFISGAFLMTGTCVVPHNDFTLHKDDRVEITIDEIGTLVNTIA